jgi:hypothetical protein
MKFTMAVALTALLATSGWAQTNETELLKQKIAEQGQQIDALQQQLARIERMLATAAGLPEAPAQPRVTNALYVQPAAVPAATAKAAPVAAQATTQPQIAGFRFGADFRYRFDASLRSANATTTGVQNMRQRYRLRFNIDKDAAADLSLHVQLATGAVNNGITFDQDFAGSVSRHPFFISEAYADYHPNANLSLRGGKQEEVFADNTRFLWDDDVRFNGFHEKWKHGRVEFRAGQYFFVNPNTFNTAAGSTLTLAGVKPGTIARAAQMFHQGMIIDAPMNKTWKSQFIVDAHIYRNPSLIALTSNAAGVTVTVNPALGITLSGGAPGTGNATTSATNTILAAGHYQVARGVYKLDAAQLWGKAKLPLSITIQGSRNVGTSQLRDAGMGTISIGRTTEKNEMRALYSFGIKDANSMISQLTDDDFGTGVTTNIATHHFRFDYALRKGIVFQNLVFRQTERRPSNPTDSLFVPLGRGTPVTWRYQGQLAISF